jgi:hypothetical protein
MEGRMNYIGGKHWHGTPAKQGIAFTFTLEMLIVRIL